MECGLAVRNRNARPWRVLFEQTCAPVGEEQARVRLAVAASGEVLNEVAHPGVGLGLALSLVELRGSVNGAREQLVLLECLVPFIRLKRPRSAAQEFSVKLR